jgi:SAM-dependent MidA family methyltransferase
MIDPRVPVPDDEARAHSARVAAHVRDEIGRAGGFITFAQYMDLVLYAPGLGYYVAGARKFGDAGDFVTAPELTPLFGAALARQIEVVVATTSAREIVELGAGSGARIEWIERLPDTIGGIVVMNEVLDAIAPNIVARRDGQWYERGVALADATFAWAERPLDDAKLLALARARFPDDGDYLSEVNPAAEALVATIAKRVGEGGILIVDYGFPAREYYHAQRASGTLVGHYRHRVHDDPFLWPGLSDLTSHVDFTAIARAGQRAGLRVAGFATQASFLLGCGLLERLRAAGTPGSVDYVRASAAVQKLLSPAEMGELFKMLLLARRDVPFLALHDVAHRL